MNFVKDPIPTKAQYYIFAVILLGSTSFLYSSYKSVFQTDLYWLYLVCFTIVGSFFPVRLFYAREKVQSITITVSDVFVFVAMLLYSPEVASVVSVIDGSIASLRSNRKKRAYRIVFNLSQLSLVTFLVGHTFYQLQGVEAPLDPKQVDNVLLLMMNLGLCALVHFFLNSGCVALAVSLVTEQPVAEIWKENFVWASVANVAGAIMAAVIFLNFERTQFFAIGIAIPIILVIYYAYKMNLDRIKQAQQHVDELNELYHSTITSLAMAIDAKDQSTHGHVQRVQAMALGLARYCGMKDENELQGLKAAALLHDIGKLAIPEYILNKPSQLTETEIHNLNEGVSGWVAANNKPLLNVSPAPDFPDSSVLRSVFKSCLAVPLSMDLSVVGVISLYSTQSNAFHQDHLRLMETIAPHAAAAINNAIIHEETQEDAYTDLLTGLPNLRYFNVFIDQELKRAARINYPVTILMMDLEHFKKVNDRYGHKVGDRVLIEIAHILRNQMRKSDTCVRYGGDEFVGVLPGVSKRLAKQTIQRMQTAIDSHQILVDDQHSVQVGISIGAATFFEDGRDADVLLALADRDMYGNKIERTRRYRMPAQVLPFEKKADQG